MTTDISVRYDPMTQNDTNNEDYDGGNSSSRLFERARIRALAGTPFIHLFSFDLPLTIVYTSFVYHRR